MSKLGSYLKKTRIGLGMTLRDVEQLSGQKVSNAYLSLIESGKRKDPHPNILKVLARVYGLDIKDLMAKAGYLDLNDKENDAKNDIELWYEKAVADPQFSFGHRRNEKIDFNHKKLIAEMYKALQGKKK